jgi:hypothetical protein
MRALYVWNRPADEESRGLSASGTRNWDLKFKHGESALLNVELGHAIFRYYEKGARQRLRKYMLENYKLWLNEEDFRTLKPHELVLVTGTYMTMNWEAATFKANSPINSVNLPVTESLTNRFVVNWRRWTNSNQGLSSGHSHLDRPQNSSLWESFGNCCHACDTTPDNFNQCIFVHGWRIRERSRLELVSIAVRDRNPSHLWEKFYDEIRKRLFPSTSQSEPGGPIYLKDEDSKSTLANDDQESLERIETASEEGTASLVRLLLHIILSLSYIKGYL